MDIIRHPILPDATRPLPKTMATTLRAFAVLAAISAIAAPIQSVAAQNAGNRPPPCTAPPYRQFDFWIGDWNVLTPDGKPAGSSRITAILGGCAILEEWTGAGGPSIGRSFNIFDASHKRWHQTWVDNGGTLAQFDGGVTNGAMILEGPAVGPKGEALLSRMTFTPLLDGRVRQVWANSSDGGKTWTDVFDGFYSRMAK